MTDFLCILGDSTVIETYLTFLQEETSKHREYIHYFYDKILWAIGISVSFICTIGASFYWITLSTIKKKFRKYWENGIQKELDAFKNKLDTEILRLEEENETVRTEYEKKIEELKRNIEFLNKLSWNGSGMEMTGSASSIHILWVDDTPWNNNGLIDFFRDNGIIVTIALDNIDAWNILYSHNHDKRVSIIITDMERYGDEKNGIELLKILRNRNITIPTVVFTSTSTDPDILKEAQRLGAQLTTSIPTDVIDFVNKFKNNTEN